MTARALFPKRGIIISASVKLVIKFGRNYRLASEMSHQTLAHYPLFWGMASVWSKASPSAGRRKPRAVAVVSGQRRLVCCISLFKPAIRR